MFIDILGREPDGVIKWSKIKDYNIPNKKGVYIIALSEPLRSPIISDIAIREWMSKADNMLLDNKKPSKDDIKNRLEEFWYPDEKIIYIGKTSGNNQTLRKRLCQYYRHQLGKRSPHRGGHWIKALLDFDELDVYWGIVEDDDPYEIEQQMMDYFSQGVSEESKQFLHDQDLLIPFANLECWKRKKKHGFRNQTK